MALNDHSSMHYNEPVLCLSGNAKFDEGSGAHATLRFSMFVGDDLPMDQRTVALSDIQDTFLQSATVLDPWVNHNRLRYVSVILGMGLDGDSTYLRGVPALPSPGDPATLIPCEENHVYRKKRKTPSFRAEI